MQFPYIPSQTGLMTIADSARLVRAIFPHYPELDVIAPAPVLVPMAPDAPAPAC